MPCDPAAGSLQSWAISSLSEPLPVAATTIGFLGPQGTFTEVALRDTLPEQAADGRTRRFIPFASMQDTIEAVSSGEVDCSIVPIENSIEGSVSATVDILSHEIDNVQIVREVRIPIQHQLLVRPGVTLDQVTKVVSHPHANAQCRIWLRANLPGVEIEAANSTANAVERVAKGDLRLRDPGPRHRGPRRQRNPVRLPGPATGAAGLLRTLQDLDRLRDRQGPAGGAAAHPAGVRLPPHQPHQDRIAAVEAALGRLHLPGGHGRQGR
jgi:hypothetical protein